MSNMKRLKGRTSPPSSEELLAAKNNSALWIATGNTPVGMLGFSRALGTSIPSAAIEIHTPGGQCGYRSVEGDKRWYYVDAHGRISNEPPKK
jgi:hypothetical protein